MPATSGEDAERGLPSSRRVAQALTATPLRPAMAVWFACIVREEVIHVSNYFLTRVALRASRFFFLRFCFLLILGFFSAVALI
jgi:hypothetical protein